MDDKEIQAAQQRLEKKRESLKQTRQIPIGLGVEVAVGDLLGDCSICGNPAYATDTDLFFLNMDIYSYRTAPKNLKCAECREREMDRLEEERREREKVADERRRQERIAKAKERSGIGERFLNLTWDDYQPVNKDAASVKKVCQEYAATFTRDACDLVMIGSCGTGKNMLASLIGLDLIEHDFRYRYTTAMRMVRLIKDSWRDKESTEQSVIDSFNYPHLLCIDEIGVQFGSPTEQLYITEIINNRYEAEKPTILISNLTLKQIEDVLGVRAVDRFHERGKFLVFNWESYRRRK